MTTSYGRSASTSSRSAGKRCACVRSRRCSRAETRAGPSAAVLRDLLERDAADWVVARSDERIAATIACHSAVRGGQALQLETMAAIVRDLASTVHPTLCPHGRPDDRADPARRREPLVRPQRLEAAMSAAWPQ